MHVCFLNRSYHPDIAATGQLLTELAEDLTTRHGWDVSVITGYPPTDTEASPREVRNGVRILRARGTTFDKRRFWKRATNYLTYFASATWLTFLSRKADVYVALTDPPIIGLPAWAAARIKGGRYIYLCQDVFPEVAERLEGVRRPIVHSILRGVSRFLVQRADAVVALGETMKRRLVDGKGAAPEKVTVIHNWADTEAIQPGPRDNGFSRENQLNGSFLVFHSGNQGLSQNLDTLIDAAEELRDDDVVFALVGDGVQREALENRAKSRNLSKVRFFPYQPKGRLHESFASADLFIIGLKAGLSGYIVPSKLYGILAAGKPYVAAVDADSEVSLITQEFQCGVRIDPGDPQSLATAIRELQRDPERLIKMSAAARQASLRFDRRSSVSAYDALLERVATRLERRTPFLKRALDVSLSGIGILVSAPLWLFIAAAIKLQDGGSIFYPQERVGRGGRIFRSFKFRSMVPDADSVSGPVQAKENDPRVTRFGRLLRATAMDELPQLWNIFTGDMSFVGPRALAAAEQEIRGNGEVVPLRDVPGFEERHSVTPGLTGIAQIYAPRDIPRRQKFRYDRLYVRQQSLWLDLRLIALSFWITFRGRWETRGEKL